MNTLTVRPLAPAESDLHRRLRLQALKESPRAFGDMLAPMERKGAAYWDALTQRVCSVDAMLLALDGERAIGMIYGLRDQHVRDGARLGGVWVDVAHRRRGAGRLLVEGVVGWAQAQRCTAARLWVGRDEAAAIALYARAGFAFTGVERALEDRPAIVIQEMQRTL